MGRTNGADWIQAVGDRIIPLGLIVVVLLIVLPLPPVVLDLLLVCNLSFSLILLLGAVNVSEPERFTALPSLLLIGTLFRLGLNISTTRQILGTGTAPDIVVAFGEFVIGGDAAVGVVIFLIITIVQFIVIAKGAERVAEVAARFTLDAMPGRQMAIDADIRTGLLTASDARARRWELQRESRLYGALDGSMKFVKGDAVACLFIAAINCIAGTIIGVFSHALSFRDSVHRYLLFTVGDGLVSQLPALFVAVAAGITVTRVTDREGTPLGRDVLRQLSSQPGTIRGTAAALGCLGFVPGIPAAPCVVIGLLLYWAAPRSDVARTSGRPVAEGLHPSGDQADSGAADTGPNGSGPHFRPRLVPPLMFSFGLGALDVIRKEAVLRPSLERLRESVFERTGVLLMEPSFEVGFPDSPNRIGITLHGVMVRECTIAATGDASDESPEPHGTGVAIELLENVLEAMLHELIDDSMTRRLLELHHPQIEDLVTHLIPRIVSVTELSVILRELLQENVCIRSMGKILQSVSESLGSFHPVVGEARNGVLLRSPALRREAIASIRIVLARSICRACSDAHGEITAWRIGEDLEELFAALSASDTPVPLAPEIEDRLATEIERLAGLNEKAVVLCSAFARPILAQLAKERRIRVPILSYDELVPEVILRTEGWIAARPELTPLAESEERPIAQHDQDHLDGVAGGI